MKNGFARIIYRRDKIKDAYGRWRKTYKRTETGVMGWGAKYDDIINALEALDLDTCTSQDLNAAMGLPKGNWGELECDGCGVQCESLLRIGEEPDYEARWLDLCSNCLRSSYKLAEKA